MNDKDFPTLENCDLNDPEEMFLPDIVGLPDIIGAPIVWPIAWWRKVSRHFHEQGWRRECSECGHREPRKKKHRMDATEDPMMGGGGRWVSADEPEPERDVLAEKLNAIRPDIKRAMLKRLQEEFPDDPALKDGGES